MSNTDGYGLVYRSVMRTEKLSPEAKAIYAYLCSFANGDGECWPGVSLMLKELGMSKDRFSKHMKPLLDAGIVTREQQTEKNLLRGYVYTVNHGSPISRQPENMDTDTRQPNSRQPDFREAGSRYPENKAPNNNSLIITSNKTPRDKTDISALVASVCDILNHNRAAKGGNVAKGKVKARAGEWYVKKILDAGHTPEEIEQRARDGNHIDWYRLEESFTGRR